MDPSPFFPNFLAVAFDAIAFIRVWRLSSAVDVPARASLLQLAKSHGREDLVDMTQEGIGERAWTARGAIYARETDPALRQAMDVLLDAEHWSLVRDD